MKILSRKILMSIIGYIGATVFVWYSKLTPAEWVTAAILIIFGYAAGEGFSKYVNIQTYKYQMYKDPTSLPVAIKNPTKWDLFMERLRAMFNAQFIGALVIYATGTLLFWYGKIGSTEWIYITVGAIVGYDVINPISKIKI